MTRPGDWRMLPFVRARPILAGTVRIQWVIARSAFLGPKSD
jgi:hypothetical protein